VTASIISGLLPAHVQKSFIDQFLSTVSLKPWIMPLEKTPCPIFKWSGVEYTPPGQEINRSSRVQTSVIKIINIGSDAESALMVADARIRKMDQDISRYILGIDPAGGPDSTVVGMYRADPREHDGLNFGQAFESSRRRWYDEIDIGEVITSSDLRRKPDLVSDWLWGPNGEFTALAKLDCFDEFLRRLIQHDTGASQTFNLRRFPDVEFRARLLPHLQGNVGAMHDLMHDLRKRSPEYKVPDMYVQFASYRDYARWAEIEEGYMRRYGENR
jgi:hypothetical protein